MISRRAGVIIAGAALAGAILVAALVRNSVAVIGYGIGPYGTAVVRTLRAELESLGIRTITIAHDSTGHYRGPRREVERALDFAATPGLSGVVGHSDSRGSLLAASIYNESRIVQIVPTGTSRLLGEAGPWTFTLAPNDSVEGDFIGVFVAEDLEAGTASVFFEADAYGRGLTTGIVEALERHGVTVIDRVPYTPSADFGVLVRASIARGIPDAVILASRDAQAGAIIRGFMARSGPAPVYVAGDGVLLQSVLYRDNPSVLDSLFVVQFWIPTRSDSTMDEFTRSFMQTNGRPPVASEAMGYDALMAMVGAILEVGRDPADVRDYLHSLGRSRPPLEGVTGPIEFPTIRTGPLLMVRARDRAVLRRSP